MVEAGALGEAVVFLSYFKDMPDPRQRGKVMYPLDEVLLEVLGGHARRQVGGEGQVVDDVGPEVVPHAGSSEAERDQATEESQSDKQRRPSPRHLHGDRHGMAARAARRECLTNPG